MAGVIGRIAVAAGLIAAGCASRLELADELYRNGALRDAVAVWRSVPEGSSDRARAQERLKVVEGELGRMLRRFEKQAAFFESEGRLAEAILYYRLALELDPQRGATLNRVQKLARELSERGSRLSAGMAQSLRAKDLDSAAQQANELLVINPLDPAVQIDVRQVRQAISAEVLRNLEIGRRAYASSDLATARSAFEAVRALEPGHEEALGYLSYIELAERPAPPEARAPTAPPAAMKSAPRAEQLLAEGHFRKGQQAERAGRPFRALEEYQRALRDESGHERARLALSRLRRELAGRVPTLYENGKRYFQDDDLHNALKNWNQVLLIQPDHTQAAENAQRAQRILERLEEIQGGS